MNDRVREYYVREYERIGAELVDNEAMGEGRVGLYLGVWSAALGGVGAIAVSDERVDGPLVSLVVAGLTVLLALGVVTTLRIVKRNYHTDELIDSLSRLRRLLRPADAPAIPAAFPWTDADGATKKRRRVLQHAGLLHVVCLANAMIPALAIVALRQRDTAVVHVIAAVALTLLVQALLLRHFNYEAWKDRNDLEKAFLEQRKAAARARKPEEAAAVE